MLNILYLLPKNLLSRFMGAVLHIRFPKVLALLLIRKFGEIYNINCDEAEKPLQDYPSVGDFFVRRLKTGARPLGLSPYVHPADSLISQVEVIRGGSLIQAKGKTYPVDDFLRDPQAKQKFENGVFATYYLCPTDYHRVHSPVAGQIKSVLYVPGNLWPVNHWSVNRIEELFCVNERVVINIQTTTGDLALVLVGATNVGKISLSFESQIVSNQGSTTARQIHYEPAKPVQKGDELGAFHMGSTVVICADAELRSSMNLDALLSLRDQNVKVRSSI